MEKMDRLCENSIPLQTQFVADKKVNGMSDSVQLKC